MSGKILYIGTSAVCARTDIECGMRSYFNMTDIADAYPNLLDMLIDKYIFKIYANTAMNRNIVTLLPLCLYNALKCINKKTYEKFSKLSEYIPLYLVGDGTPDNTGIDYSMQFNDCMEFDNYVQLKYRKLNRICVATLHTTELFYQQMYGMSTVQLYILYPLSPVSPYNPDSDDTAVFDRMGLLPTKILKYVQNFLDDFYFFYNEKYVEAFDKYRKNEYFLFPFSLTGEDLYKVSHCFNTIGTNF